MHQNSISAGALPQTPLEELTVLPGHKLDIRGLLLTEGRGGRRRLEAREESNK